MSTFAAQRKAWSSPPLDDIGYISSKHLLSLSDTDFLMLLKQAALNRYSGWRNEKGVWRDMLGLDTTRGKRVLDYGCGAGFEAFEYARAGNEVHLADISEENLAVASRLFRLLGRQPQTAMLLTNNAPVNLVSLPLDVIHCSGVLHHIRKPEPVVEKMAGWLADDGELRLMVYSDRSWRSVVHCDPPEDVASHPKALEFAQAMDGVGTFADWYSPERLEQRFGEWFSLSRHAYLKGGYLLARMVKR